MKKTSRTPSLRIHPLANMVPAMSAESFAALKDDIARGGLIEPIWTKDGQIIDGRNRYRACRELGIAVTMREYEGDDIEAFVISTAVARRHLTPQQRAGLIKRLRALHPEKTNSEIAAMVGVSKSTVHDVTTSVFQDRKTAPQPIDSSIPLRIGKDGKRYPSTKTKRVAVVHPAASLVNPTDFEMKQFIKWLSDLDPGRLSDAAHFLSLLREQVQRISEEINQSAAA